MHFKNISVFITLSVLITLILILIQPYFSLDEPNILWEIKQGLVWNNYFNNFISGGRPIYGWLLIHAIEIAGQLDKFWFFRMIGLLLTFLFCCLIFNFLRRNQLTSSVSFLIAALIFCLPGFFLFIGWSECFPHQLSSILSFYAGMLTFNVFSWLLGKERISKSKENLYIFCAFILQTTALLNYQGTALSFILPGFFALLFSTSVSSQNKRRFFAYYILIFFLSLGLYYMIYKSLLGYYQLQAVNRSKIGTDYLDKLQWFVKVFLEASKLHFLLFKSFIIQNFLSFGLFLLIIRDLYKKRWTDLFFLLIFSLLSVLPHLIVEESWGASRNFALMSALIIFYMIYRCQELFTFLKAPLAILLSIPFLIFSLLNIECAFVKPLKQDYKYLYSKVKELPALKDTIYIAVKLPLFSMHDKNSFLRSYYDEFNISPLFYEWPVAPAIKCFYSELHPEYPIARIDAQINVKLYQPVNNVRKTIIWDLNYK